MGSEELRHRFLSALGDSDRDVFAAWPELGNAFARALGAAHAAWPNVTGDASAFAAHLGARIRTDLPPGEAFAAMHVTDLYLAWACLTGDPEALHELERNVLSRVTGALRRLRLDADLVDEALQVLRGRLLLPNDAEPAKLVQYAGRGELRRWLRIVAVRDALSLQKRARKQPIPLSDELLAAVPAAASDAELVFLREEYGEHLKRAFGQAVAELPDSERQLLRYHIAEGLTIDQIAALLDVHRATAARQVARARDRLGNSTKRCLQRQLGLDPFEVTSLMRIIDSQIDLSVQRLLGQ